jgi:hypothetical protein
MIQNNILMSNNEKNNQSNKPIIKSSDDGFLTPQVPQQMQKTSGMIYQLNAQAGNLLEATTLDIDTIDSSLQNINKLVNKHLKTLLTNTSTSTNLDSILSYLMEKNNMRSYSLNDEDSRKAFGKDQEIKAYQKELIEQRHVSLSLLGRKVKRNNLTDSQFDLFVPDEHQSLNKTAVKEPAESGMDICNNNVQQTVYSLPQKLRSQKKLVNGLCAQAPEKNTDININNNNNNKNEIFNCIIDKCEKLSSSKVNSTERPKPFEEVNFQLEDREISKNNIIVNLQANIFNIRKVQRKVNPSATNWNDKSKSSHNISVFIF